MNDFPSLDALRAAMPAYVLGALSPEERIVYERALRLPENSAVLRGEFDACQATMNVLSSAQPVEPPAGLLERVYERIRAETPDVHAASASLDASAPTLDRRSGEDRRNEERRNDDRRHDERREEDRAGDHQERRQMDRRADDRRQQERRQEERRHDERRQDERRHEERRAHDEAAASRPVDRTPAARPALTSRATRAITPPPMAAVEPRSGLVQLAGWWTAAVLFVALVSVGYYAASLRRDHAEIEGRLRESRVLLSRSDARLAERERLMTTLLGGRASVLLVNLRSETPEGPAAQLFWNTREGRSILNVFGMPVLPADRRYQLWMIRDGVPTPLVDVTPNDGGAVLVPGIEMPSSPTGVTQLFITNEARQGTPAAPSAPHVVNGVIPIRQP